MIGLLKNLLSGIRNLYHQRQARRVIKDIQFAQAVRDVLDKDAHTKAFLEAEKQYKSIMFDADKKAYISQGRIKETVDLLDKGRFAAESGGRNGLLISYSLNLQKLLDESAKSQEKRYYSKPAPSLLELRNQDETESNAFFKEQSETLAKAKQLYTRIMLDAEKNVAINHEQIRDALALFSISRFAPEYRDASDKSSVLHNAYVHNLRGLLEDKSQLGIEPRAFSLTSREAWERVCISYPKAMASKDVDLVKQTLADAKNGAYCNLESLLTLDLIKSNLYLKLAEIERAEHEQEKVALLVAIRMYRVIKYDVERNIPLCEIYIKKALDLFDKLKDVPDYRAKDSLYTEYYNYLLVREKNQAILKIRVRMQ